MLQYLPWVAVGVFLLQKLKEEKQKNDNNKRRIKIGFVGM